MKHVQREIVFVPAHHLFRVCELAAIASIKDARARYDTDQRAALTPNAFFYANTQPVFLGVDFLVESNACCIVANGAPYTITELDEFVTRKADVANHHVRVAAQMSP